MELSWGDADPQVMLGALMNDISAVAMTTSAARGILSQSVLSTMW